ncbi:hypothetical protein CKM354_000255700 [Cercospora kikuchii]|uniref:Zn(2)-C6 fungal-type domain-containing protein n=1 Tax=Cercospora kikuchii TaxID=84275 RepID=A0A9P3F9E8_9PEZI|nr:uncharacterized protein CKM354_000255700 [Cercospora kikuchii]GIZ39166.1 hypothetical protein CKM354_000255700 [Cercospora kikuchii]
MASASPDKASAPRRPRAARACSFCKLRKFKCGNQAPQCGNCRTYEKECVYPERGNRVRPTNAIISALREENRGLRSRLSIEASSSGNDGRQPVPKDASTVASLQGSSNEAGPTDATAASTPESVGKRAPASLSKNATYHGPTSALYEDLPSERPSQPWFNAERENRMSTLLFAEAAKQRQMEVVNTARGLLDFDGVDPEMGLHLLNLHWNRQHHSFLVTYRPAFMRDMVCHGPYFSKILLNAIYFGSSKFSPRLELRKDPDDVRTAGWRFRERVRELLGEAMDQSRITTIQALLQMTNSLFALGDEQSAAWLYSGLAFRMIIDLGLHIDATLMPGVRTLTDEDLEIRRRVFWGAFVIDKIQSLYQGRPATLQASQCDVPIVFKDEYEELEHWAPFAYTDRSASGGTCSYSVSTFTQLCRLCIILNHVLNKVYKEKRAAEGPETPKQELSALDKELVTWTEQLPPHLSIDIESKSTSDTPPPHVLSLLAMANVIRILLHRPFVSDGHLHSSSPSVAVSSFTQCATAATSIVKIVRKYDKAYSVGRAPYLISYATYVAATIHVRIASKRGASSEAHACLRTCLSLLKQNSATNYAVRKAILVIESLMTRMGVQTPEKPEVTTRPQQSTTTAAVSAPVLSQHTSPGTDTYSPSAMGWEPTFIAGNMAPDLDVDAIIRSFMQEQGAENNTFIPGGTSYPDLTGELGYLPTNAHQRFDDMIFGFNATDFDAMM